MGFGLRLVGLRLGEVIVELFYWENHIEKASFRLDISYYTILPKVFLHHSSIPLFHYSMNIAKT